MVSVKPKKGRTAGELQELLLADPEYQARKREIEAELQKGLAERKAAEAPLVKALNERGAVCVESVWQLVNSPEQYPQAIPILLEHLQRPYPDDVLEGIARALAVPDAIVGWPLLLRLFRDSGEQRLNGVKTAIGCALAAAATERVVPDLIELVRDRRHGEHRIVFLEALANSNRADARAALEEAGQDQELTREVRFLLRRVRRRR